MATTESKRAALLLSAFVYPGAGQFVQKRWIVGFLFATLFTVFLGALVVNAITPMVHNITAALDWAQLKANRPFELISLPGIIIPFLLALTVYIANIVDVMNASRPKPPPLP